MSKDCSVLDTTGQAYYCAEVGKMAICKDAGKCGLLAQLADPFGLYYSRQTCYGVTDPVKTDPKNYCYYDYPTITGRCGTCDEVINCFDYVSSFACEKDNETCFAGEELGCEWLDLIPDLDKGICIQKGYNESDMCGLCGQFFFNLECTQEVCSKLGECFANEDNSACEGCVGVICEDYNTETACGAGLSFVDDVMLDDQSLVIDVECKGLIVVSGCAHSGIINTIKCAQKIVGNTKLYAVLGGFHLMSANDKSIQGTIDE